MSRLLLGGLLLVVSAATLCAQPGGGNPGGLKSTHIYGDVVIRELWTVGSESAGTGRGAEHGYYEYRFLIENRSKGEAHTVTLTIPSDREGGYSLVRLTRTVEVPADSKVEVSLFQPDTGLDYSGASSYPVGVAVDGVREERTFSVAAPDRYSREARMGVFNQHRVLATRDVALDLEEWDRRHGGRFGGNGPFLKTQEDPRAWGKDWLGYGSLDGIVVKAKDLEQAPPEVEQALWQYVETGGALLILGDYKVPDGWAAEPQPFWGPGSKRYYGGFGECVVAAEADVPKWQAGWDPVAGRVVGQQPDKLQEFWAGSAGPWAAPQSAAGVNGVFPVVEQRGLPVRTLFMIMVVFTVLVGPVNFFVLTKINRRLWMLWTVPCFSLVACLAVFAYMVVYEGWQGHVRIESVTVLDEVAQRATTIGWYGAYSPITPGGLHFDRDTELTPTSDEQFDPYGGHRPSPRNRGLRAVDWTDDQHLASGWVSARVPAHLRVRRSERRLERLLVRKGGGGAPEIVNGLKAPIESLWVADAGGKVYVASGVAAGAEAALTPAPSLKAEGEPAALREVYRGQWFNLPGRFAAAPGHYLRPGSYIAVLGEAPFVSQGLSGAVQEKSKSVVFGVLREPPTF